MPYKEITPGTLLIFPKEKKATGCRWVYKDKLDSDGSLERFKVTLVAKGCNQ